MKGIQDRVDFKSRDSYFLGLVIDFDSAFVQIFQGFDN